MAQVVPTRDLEHQGKIEVKPGPAGRSTTYVDRQEESHAAKEGYLKLEVDAMQDFFDHKMAMHAFGVYFCLWVGLTIFIKMPILLLALVPFPISILTCLYHMKEAKKLTHTALFLLALPVWIAPGVWALELIQLDQKGWMILPQVCINSIVALIIQMPPSHSIVFHALQCAVLPLFVLTENYCSGLGCLPQLAIPLVLSIVSTFLAIAVQSQNQATSKRTSQAKEVEKSSLVVHKSAQHTFQSHFGPWATSRFMVQPLDASAESITFAMIAYINIRSTKTSLDAADFQQKNQVANLAYDTVKTLAKQSAVEVHSNFGDWYFCTVGVKGPKNPSITYAEMAYQMAAFCVALQHAISNLPSPHQAPHTTNYKLAATCGIACGPLMVGMMGPLSMRMAVWGCAAHQAAKACYQTGTIHVTHLFKTLLEGSPMDFAFSFSGDNPQRANEKAISCDKYKSASPTAHQVARLSIYEDLPHAVVTKSCLKSKPSKSPAQRVSKASHASSTHLLGGGNEVEKDPTSPTTPGGKLSNALRFDRSMQVDGTMKASAEKAEWQRLKREEARQASLAKLKARQERRASEDSDNEGEGPDFDFNDDRMETMHLTTAGMTYVQKADGSLYPFLITKESRSRNMVRFVKSSQSEATNYVSLPDYVHSNVPHIGWARLQSTKQEWQFRKSIFEESRSAKAVSVALSVLAVGANLSTQPGLHNMTEFSIVASIMAAFFLLNLWLVVPARKPVQGTWHFLILAGLLVGCALVCVPLIFGILRPMTTSLEGTPEGNLEALYCMISLLLLDLTFFIHTQRKTMYFPIMLWFIVCPSLVAIGLMFKGLSEVMDIFALILVVAAGGLMTTLYARYYCIATRLAFLANDKLNEKLEWGEHMDSVLESIVKNLTPLDAFDPKSEHVTTGTVMTCHLVEPYLWDPAVVPFRAAASVRIPELLNQLHDAHYKFDEFLKNNTSKHIHKAGVVDTAYIANTTLTPEIDPIATRELYHFAVQCIAQAITNNMHCCICLFSAPMKAAFQTIDDTRRYHLYGSVIDEMLGPHGSRGLPQGIIVDETTKIHLPDDLFYRPLEGTGLSFPVFLVRLDYDEFIDKARTNSDMGMRAKFSMRKN